MLCQFRATTCSAFLTTELPKETAARGRKTSQRQAKTTSKIPTPPTEASKTSVSAESAGPSECSTDLPSKKKKKKTFNLSTYKVHALGDYVRTIRMFGTTDSYSTQTACLNTMQSSLFVMVTHLALKGELEHWWVKRLYGRNNKNGAIKQMTKHEHRETRLLRARRTASSQHTTTHPHHVAFSEQDLLPYTDAAMHHHISDTKRHGLKGCLLRNAPQFWISMVVP